MNSPIWVALSVVLATHSIAFRDQVLGLMGDILEDLIEPADNLL